MTALSTYRVELRQAHMVRVLAHAILANPHKSELDPFVSRLKLDGKTGVVFLIECETGTVVARQRVP